MPLSPGVARPDKLLPAGSRLPGRQAEWSRGLHFSTKGSATWELPLIPQIVEARRSRGEASRAEGRALRRAMRRGLRYGPGPGLGPGLGTNRWRGRLQHEGCDVRIMVADRRCLLCCLVWARRALRVRAAITSTTQEAQKLKWVSVFCAPRGMAKTDIVIWTNTVIHRKRQPSEN